MREQTDRRTPTCGSKEKESSRREGLETPGPNLSHRKARQANRYRRYAGTSDSLMFAAPQTKSCAKIERP